jgi:hypothetical protein
VECSPSPTQRRTAEVARKAALARARTPLRITWELSKSAFPGYPRCCCARTIRATTYMKARECRLNRHFPIPASANAIVWCKNIHSSNFPLDRRQVLPKL